MFYIKGKNSDKFNLPMKNSCRISSAQYLPSCPSRELSVEFG